jgi:plasmid stabilization system protein ParE
MIRYRREALVDVDRLLAWWLERSDVVAQRFLDRVLDTEQRIASRPGLFPPSKDGDTRRCLMRFGRSVYVLHFIIEGADQVIVRIWHGREDRR